MMDEPTILKMGQEVRILWGKWENVVGTISAIEHIRGGVFYRVNNDEGERSPNLYGISHLDVIQNTTDKPTVDELKAQVDALVSEVAHLQAMIPHYPEPKYPIGTRVRMTGLVPRGTIGTITAIEYRVRYILGNSGNWRGHPETGNLVYRVNCDDGSIRRTTDDGIYKLEG